MKKDSRIRTIEYKNHVIAQSVAWKENSPDGAGYEVKTIIDEIPNYSGFAQMVWLTKEQQKAKIEDQITKAKYAIDTKIKEAEPDLFDELGFE